MELKKVLLGIEGIKARGNLDLDIVGIEKNSKEVKKGYMFIAIKGFLLMDISLLRVLLKMVLLQLCWKRGAI